MYKVLILLVIAMPFFCAGSDKPNILFIITDQHHSKMLSCADNPYLKTKALDGLAQSGVRFTKAYVTNPVCFPSRISMATGVMPGRFGVFTNSMKADIPRKFSKNSLGNLMKAAGYETFYGGKVHMAPELDPKKAGYDEICKDDRDGLVKECVSFITQKRDKPFFAVASFINPHDICFAYNAKNKQRKSKRLSLVNKLFENAQKLPDNQLPPLPGNQDIPKLEPEAVGLSMKDKAVTPAKLMRKDYTDRDWRVYRWIYCRLTEKVDGQIGQILDSLKENNLEENTMIIFSSDHGDMDGSHRLASKNVFYENSVNVPFIVKYKGVIPAGKVNNESLVSNGLDILPTICHYAGVKIPDYLHGRSLKQVAEGGEDNPRRPYVVAENGTGRMLRTKRFKYCVYIEGKNRESLVDLEKDPGEMENLAQNPEFKEVLNRHREFLEEWTKESGDKEAEKFIIKPE